MQIPAAEIFKAYDIRGVVGKTLTADAARTIGQAIGSEARARGQHAIAIGRDGRLSGPMLAAALAEGICAAGVDVIDIGMVATPLSYFAAFQLGTDCAISVTGSHNPPDYNGLKMVLAGETLAGAQIQALRQRIEQGELAEGQGRVTQADVRQAYIDRIVGDVKLARAMKIAIDCGNGVAGDVAPRLFRALGCEVRRVVLRGGRQLSQSPSRSVQAGESCRISSAGYRRQVRNWDSHSTATAIAWAS